MLLGNIQCFPKIILPFSKVFCIENTNSKLSAYTVECTFINQSEHELLQELFPEAAGNYSISVKH
jgi:hypothetical protein